MNEVVEPETTQKFAEKLSLKIARSMHYSAVNLAYSKQIMCAQLSGSILLPHGLGLDPESYQQLRKAVDDSDLMRKELDWYKSDWKFIRERAALCAELFIMKEDERQEIITLLTSYRNMQDPSSKEMAVIVATASLTSFHLWESLGLPDRTQLGDLIQHNFPDLYALNTDNMRWKRFFYRQLCEQDGDYICRAPSCEECKSYDECFEKSA